jgi:hypothetical protein
MDIYNSIYYHHQQLFGAQMQNHATSVMPVANWLLCKAAKGPD